MEVKNDQLSIVGTDYKKVAAWFLGPNGENQYILSELINKGIQDHVNFRKSYYNDPPDIEPYITDDIKNSNEYTNQIENLRIAQKELANKLTGCAPFSSWRYQGHMEWDLVLPGVIGYFTAMLYNQNNVATEAGPATSYLETQVGSQLCTLMGFNSEKSWGHITADGTIANIEAMWSARNIKLFPLALKDAINKVPELERAKEELMITIFEDNYLTKDFKLEQPKLLSEASDWELLNLTTSFILSLPRKIVELCGLEDKQKLDKDPDYVAYNIIYKYVSKYLVESIGLTEFIMKHSAIQNMKIIVPSSDHYSWPKGAGILGLGQENIVKIPINNKCQMNTNILKEKLLGFFNNKYPVLMVVAVMGSTAEGAVDNLEEILKLRETFSRRNFNFTVHCDAAWGGYMRSILIEPSSDKKNNISQERFVPALALSPYAQTQFKLISEVDSATVDPHKAGFIPYPAGSICYKNNEQRLFISNDADYIHSDLSLKVGIYGIEGSKPGAAPAAVWMTNKVIPLDRSGYGQILGECNYSTKLYYCYWITLAEESDDFDIETLVSLPKEIKNIYSGKTILRGRKQILQFIRSNILGKTNEEIAKNNDAISLLQQVGADVLINSFVVNFKVNGEFNHDINKMNTLNEELFNLFSITKPKYKDQWDGKPEYILTSTKQKYEDYGQSFDNFCEKWALQNKENSSITFLINTIMQPWPNMPNIVGHVMDIFKKGIEETIQRIINEP